MGIVPIWGYQLLVGIALAHILKLNKTIFVLAANISIPPMIPLIIYLSCSIGASILHQPWTMPAWTKIGFQLIKQHLYIYLVGSCTLAVIAAVAGGLLCYILLNIFQLKTKTI
jgi:uncharacterized protein (DUF2062 family)